MKKTVKIVALIDVEVPDKDINDEMLEDASRVLYKMDGWDDYFKHIADDVFYTSVTSGMPSHVDGIGEIKENWNAKWIEWQSYVIKEEEQ